MKELQRDLENKIKQNENRFFVTQFVLTLQGFFEYFRTLFKIRPPTIEKYFYQLHKKKYEFILANKDKGINILLFDRID